MATTPTCHCKVGPYWRSEAPDPLPAQHPCENGMTQKRSKTSTQKHSNIHLVRRCLPINGYRRQVGHGGVAQIFASRARCRRKSEAQLADFRLPSWEVVVSVLWRIGTLKVGVPTAVPVVSGSTSAKKIHHP